MLIKEQNEIGEVGIKSQEVQNSARQWLKKQADIILKRNILLQEYA